MSTWLILIAFIWFGQVMSVNISVDDASPMWTYTGLWRARGPGFPCSACVQNPDPSQAFDNTWHDTSAISATASITFNGISVSVYAILPVNTSFAIIDQYGFSLNGVASTPFNINATGNYIYNTRIFSASSLDPGSSTTLSIAMTGQSTILLDYLVYDNGAPASSSTSTSTSTPTGSSNSTASHASPFPVAAVVVPTVVVVSSLLALIAYFLWRRIGRNRGAGHAKPTIYQTSDVGYPSRMPEASESIPPPNLATAQTDSLLQDVPPQYDQVQNEMLSHA